MKKILVVDDEKQIRELLKKKLELHGFAVSIASGGKEALQLCKSEKPDLVLLDIAMPDMDGYETCEKIKCDSGTCQSKVLFLTAKEFDMRGLDDHFRNSRAEGYMEKPASFDELLQKINELLQ